MLAACPLPTAVGVTALFNYVVTPFPLSVLCAVCFLCNWRGYHAALRRALWRRFGGLGAVAIELILISCAACAVVKPLLFGSLQWLNHFLGADALLRVGEAVNWLGFVFEYVLGVALQIYVVLLCFAWVRGLSFEYEELRRFALRRLSFVLKWAGVVLLLSSAGINLPLLLASFRPVADVAAEAAAVHVVVVARWLLAAILLVFCSMQITLVFHNESLRRAFADHWRLVRLHRWPIAWLLWIAVLHFTLLAALDATLLRGLGERTWPAAFWESLLYPALWSVLAAWLLASWVCLFRRCATGRPDADQLVRF